MAQSKDIKEESFLIFDQWAARRELWKLKSIENFVESIYIDQWDRPNVVKLNYI